MIRVHKDTHTGCYHPVPGDDVDWAVHDSRGYADGGPSCDNAGQEGCIGCECANHTDGGDECVGLSFAYVCMDGGESLCEACAEKEGLEVIDCDCK